MTDRLQMPVFRKGLWSEETCRTIEQDSCTGPLVTLTFEDAIRSCSPWFRRTDSKEIERSVVDVPHGIVRVDIAAVNANDGYFVFWDGGGVPVPCRSEEHKRSPRMTIRLITALSSTGMY